MVILIPLPQGIWEGGHDPCPSSLEKWRSEVMATSIPLLDGMREGGCGLCLSLLRNWRGVRQPIFPSS